MMTRKNLLNLLALITMVTGGLLVSTPAHAWRYLSGYSNSGGSYGEYYYPSGGRSHIDTSGGHSNQHTASTRRKAEAKARANAKLKWYDQNPPCGTYGRLPKRCKTGDLNLADRN